MKKHGFSIGQNMEKRPLELRFYHRFQHIRQRCTNPKNASFKNYGAMGVKFLWTSFEDFKNDMWESFQDHINKHGEKNTSIDRINNEGHYGSDNCKWSTMREQRRNSSQNKMFEFNGEKLCLIEIAEKVNMNYRVLVKRIYAGWSLTRALKRPVTKNRWLK